MTVHESLAAVGPQTITTGRLLGTVAAFAALGGIVVGGLAVARSGRRSGQGRGIRGALAAVAAGLAGMAVGGYVVAVAEAGPGTGYGIVGGFAALALGLVAAALGGVALARAHRRPLPSPTGPR